PRVNPSSDSIEPKSCKPDFGAIGRRDAAPPSRLLLQSYLVADPADANIAVAERRLHQHASEVTVGICALLEKAQRHPRGDARHPPELHPLNLVSDRRIRGVTAQIDDEAGAARFEDTVHFAKRTDRIAEILERRTTDDEVEPVAGKRHRRSI